VGRSVGEGWCDWSCSKKNCNDYKIFKKI